MSPHRPFKQANSFIHHVSPSLLSVSSPQDPPEHDIPEASLSDFPGRCNPAKRTKLSRLRKDPTIPVARPKHPRPTRFLFFSFVFLGDSDRSLYFDFQIPGCSSSNDPLGHGTRKKPTVWIFQGVMDRNDGSSRVVQDCPGISCIAE